MTEWRYLLRGQVVHGFTRAPEAHGIAPCGTSPVWYDPSGWLGTGTQSEYERAATLPKCRRCVRHHGGGQA